MTPGPPGVLRTSRLRLEPLREEHAVEMVDLLAPDDLYTFTGGAGPTIDQLKRRYRSQIAGPADGGEIWLNWILRDDESGSAAGLVQATVVGRSADIAWLVGLDFQQRGFGTEAATAMCAWLRESGVQRLDAHIHPDHLASQRIASALGLARTGDVDEDDEEIWSS